MVSLSNKSTSLRSLVSDFIGHRWALVMRDWSRAQVLNYYSIHPSQFSTRMPLHINDEDLCPATLKVDVHGHVTERPQSEFTMLSYTVHILKVAMLARESVDLRGPLSQARRQQETNESGKMRNHLNRKYEDFVAGLPTYFRLGSTVGNTSIGPMAAVPVQRWMLHQQLWSLFLRLYRASLASQNGRASCQLMAQNIISTQAQIQARCAVCGSLSTSKIQLFNAAIVLLIDLLFSPKHKDADPTSAALSRLMTRDKIREAIELLRTRSDAEGSQTPQDLRSERVRTSAQRSVLALEALTKLEEEESGNNKNEIGANSIGKCPGKQDKKSHSNTINIKVMETLEALDGNAGNCRNAIAASEPANYDIFSVLDMSTSSAAAADGVQDIDVLPVLSNDMNCDFWQFLNFTPPQSPTENGPTSATADMQNLGGSMLLSPSSGPVQSLSSLGIPEYADVYSSTDGSRATHTTLSSIESGSTKLSGGSEVATTPLSMDASVAGKNY